jgi:filamentous hemagglutinin family protein
VRNSSIYTEFRKKVNTYIKILTAIVISFSLQKYCNAQIVPDITLSTQSSQVVNSTPNIQLIGGGALRGSNLLHSFSQFNINNGSAAYFLDPGVRNIVGRVTGASPSDIKGLLGVRGNANLYLINPQGFIFGPNSKLDLNGALTITTGSSLGFDKGYIFDTLNANGVPLLELGNPSLINYNNNHSGTIQINGSGQTLFQAGNIFSPVAGFGQSINGILTRPGKQVSLLGGEILFNGGVLTSPSGNVTIGAIGQGKVNLKTNNGVINFDFSNISDFKNLSLTNKSIIDTSGLGLGITNVFAKNLLISDGSLIINSNLSTSSAIPGGLININLAGDLDIQGISSKNSLLQNGQIPRGIVSQTFFGNGADISIVTNNLTLSDSSGLISSTFGSGKGGTIFIKDNSTKILGGSSYGVSSLGSLLLTTSAGVGPAGEIKLNTNNLLVQDGGYLISAAFGAGQGGNVFLNASNIVLAGGIIIPQSLTFNPSSIASTTISSGNAGNLEIATNNLSIKDGARVTASTLSSGQAGKVTINANNIDLYGAGPTLLGLPNPSSIDSSAVKVGPFLQYVFNLPASSQNLTGNSGELNINTKSLNIAYGASIAVENDGTGNAGRILINAQNVNLNDGIISSTTAGGNGGNTTINADILTLRNSSINSTARFFGSGGNTTIVAQGIAGDYKSTISANAEKGFGGNIDITTKALIFPLQNITATSQNGLAFNGTVNIKSVNFTPLKSVEVKPNNFVQPSLNICNPTQGQSFRITAANLPDEVDDLKETSSNSNSTKLPYIIDKKGHKIPFVRMQGFVVKSNGMAETVAYNNSAFGGAYVSKLCRIFSTQNALKN